jgi:hypothetical protein
LEPPTNAGGGGVRVNLVQTGWCELKSWGYDMSNSEISDSILKDGQRDGEQNAFALFFCYSPNFDHSPLRL